MEIYYWVNNLSKTSKTLYEQNHRKTLVQIGLRNSCDECLMVMGGACWKNSSLICQHKMQA